MESIDALFAANSLFSWNMERNYQEHGEVLLNRGQGKEGNILAGYQGASDDVEAKPSNEHLTGQTKA